MERVVTAAMQAINTVFSDISVPVEKTLERMKDLRELIDEKIEALECTK